MFCSLVCTYLFFSIPGDRSNVQPRLRIAASEIELGGLSSLVACAPFHWGCDPFLQHPGFMEVSVSNPRTRSSTLERFQTPILPVTPSSSLQGHSSPPWDALLVYVFTNLVVSFFYFLKSWKVLYFLVSIVILLKLSCFFFNPEILSIYCWTFF